MAGGESIYEDGGVGAQGSCEVGEKCLESEALAELMEGTTYPLDFCAMHNHMQKTGIPTKCWRCGDKE